MVPVHRNNYNGIIAFDFQHRYRWMVFNGSIPGLSEHYERMEIKTLIYPGINNCMVDRRIEDYNTSDSLHAHIPLFNSNKPDTSSRIPDMGKI